MQIRGHFQPVADGVTLAFMKGCVGSTETTMSGDDMETRRKPRGLFRAHYKGRQARPSDGRARQSWMGDVSKVTGEVFVAQRTIRVIKIQLCRPIVDIEVNFD